MEEKAISGKDYQTTISHLAQRITEVQNELEIVKLSKNTLSGANRNLQKKVDALEKQLKMAYGYDEVAMLKGKLSILQEENKNLQFSALNKNYAASQTEAVILRSKLNSVIEQLDKLNNSNKSLLELKTSFERDLDNVRKERNTLQDKLESKHTFPCKDCKTARRLQEARQELTRFKRCDYGTGIVVIHMAVESYNKWKKILDAEGEGKRAYFINTNENAAIIDGKVYKPFYVSRSRFTSDKIAWSMQGTYRFILS